MDAVAWNQWATTSGVEVRHGNGAVILAPRDERQLIACVTVLRDRALPYRLAAGTGEAVGGGASVVIELRGLAGVDDVAEDRVTVGGGATWLALLEHLAPRQRRPQGVPEDPLSSIGGTLAVGTPGDTGHRLAQAPAVTAMTLITPDGERRELAPDAELFRFSLAGGGQLGAIAQVTLRLEPQPAWFTARLMAWNSVREFIRDALVIAALDTHQVVRARLFWGPRSCAVRAVVGAMGCDQVDLPLLRPGVVGLATERVNLHEKRGAAWPAGPALGLVFGLPEGLLAWHLLCAFLEESQVARGLARGWSSIHVVPGPASPLAPAAGWSFVAVLRPEAPAAEQPRLEALLGEVAVRALELGASPCLTGTPADGERRDLLSRGLGAVWERWAALKRTVDPTGLCNPGLFSGAAAP